MTRLPRITLPGIPYHIIQRGNRRQPMFFGEAWRVFLYLQIYRL